MQKAKSVQNLCSAGQAEQQVGFSDKNTREL